MAEQIQPKNEASEKGIKDLSIDELVELSKSFNPFIASKAVNELVTRSEEQRKNSAWRKALDKLNSGSNGVSHT